MTFGAFEQEVHARKLEILMELRRRIPTPLGVTLGTDLTEAALVGVFVTGSTVFRDQIVPNIFAFGVMRRSFKFLLGRFVAFGTLQFDVLAFEVKASLLVVKRQSFFE